VRDAGPTLALCFGAGLSGWAQRRELALFESGLSWVDRFQRILRANSCSHGPKECAGLPAGLQADPQPVLHPTPSKLRQSRSRISWRSSSRFAQPQAVTLRLAPSRKLAAEGTGPEGHLVQRAWPAQPLCPSFATQRRHPVPCSADPHHRLHPRRPPAVHRPGVRAARRPPLQPPPAPPNA